jgi:hypothetical protein
MRTWVLGALVGACVGVTIYLVLKKPLPKPVAEQTSSAAVATLPAPVEPVVLAQVVDVADIDHLLDPPARAETGVPFDTEPATQPVTPPPTTGRIPPAVDEPEIAPMPRIATGQSFHF